MVKQQQKMPCLIFYHRSIIEKYQIADSYPSSPTDDGHF
jgi:hypothetical protein